MKKNNDTTQVTQFVSILKRFVEWTFLPLLLMTICHCAVAQQSAVEETIVLSFSIGNTTQDMLPLVIGTSETAERELIKPPAVPGKVHTGSDDDKLLNAYISRDGKKIQTSVVSSSNLGQGNEAVYTWKIDVNSEATTDSVTINASPRNCINCELSFFIPGQDDGHVTHKFVVVDSNAIPNDMQWSFSMSAGQTKTIYAIIGDSHSFIYSDSAGEVIGLVRIRDVPGIIDKYNVKATINNSAGTQVGNSVDVGNGQFTFTNVPQGTYSVHIEGDTLLSAKASIQVPVNGSNFSVFRDLLGGNGNQDSEVDFTDFKLLKLCYKKTSDDELWTIGTSVLCPASSNPCDCSEANYDRSSEVDGVEKVDFGDFKILKLSYKKEAVP